jgi:hypothetical protein
MASCTRLTMRVFASASKVPASPTDIDEKERRVPV